MAHYFEYPDYESMYSQEPKEEFDWSKVESVTLPCTIVDENGNVLEEIEGKVVYKE